ncbi:MAG TPA: alpha/beta fold hydrolase, partial [Gemmatimonadales bacterium]|nr:alpha/beta fold hydrolase [Gemmatimonadales bacterium]
PAHTPGPAVVILHGFKGFKDWGMFPVFAERLAQAGYLAVSFNTSGSGVDEAGRFSRLERFRRNSFSAEVADLLAVIKALEAGKLGVPVPTAIGVVGHSRGGGIAILAARQSPRIKALVTWSAISTVRRWTQGELARWRRDGFLAVLNTRTGEQLPLGPDTLHDVEKHAEGRLNIEAAAAALKIPWLLIHGAADESVPLTEAEALAAAAPKATTRVRFLEGAGHTFGAVHPFAGMTPVLERCFDESLNWLRQHLPIPANR